MSLVEDQLAFQRNLIKTLRAERSDEWSRLSGSGHERLTTETVEELKTCPCLNMARIVQYRVRGMILQQIRLGAAEQAELDTQDWFNCSGGDCDVKIMRGGWGGLVVRYKKGCKLRGS